MQTLYTSMSGEKEVELELTVPSLTLLPRRHRYDGRASSPKGLIADLLVHRTGHLCWRCSVVSRPDPSLFAFCALWKIASSYLAIPPPPTFPAGLANFLGVCTVTPS